MEADEILAKIANFELDNRIQSLEFHDVNIWPIIRSELQFKLRRGDEYELKRKPAKWPKKTLLSIFKTELVLRKIFPKIKSGISKQIEGKADVLLFSEGNAYYSDTVEGKLYNRHLDPFYESYTKLGVKTSKFHYLKADEIQTKYILSNNVILNKELNEWIWFFSFKNFSDSKYTGLNEVCNEFQISYESVLKRLHYILALKEVSKIVIQSYAPKAIGLICFYCDESMAMVLAAKELGVKTFDIQHGKQGEKHFCYSHYTKLPTNGYSLIPDYFWNWGEDSAENINGKFKNTKNSFKCIPGGNLWMAKWKNTNFYKETDEEIAYFANKSKYEKSVLIGAQPLSEEVIPDFVKATMIERKDVFWGIRLHPYQKELLPNMEQEFEAFDNIDITMSTDIPLYLAMRRFDYILTKWSSVGLEGLFFNMRAVIIDDFGVKSFQKYVDNKMMQVALDKYELEKVLNTGAIVNDVDLNKSINLVDEKIEIYLKLILG